MVKGTPKEDNKNKTAYKSTVKYSARERRDGASTTNSTRPSSYTVYDALDELVNKSHKIGADGIINLRIIYTFDTEYGQGYNISGMAIRRDGK